ncbi:MAG: cobalamin-independent methionine synthase II family protein [Campylobacteraceae bacterium]
MIENLPKFPTSLMGSWPRSSDILSLIHKNEDSDEFAKKIELKTKEIVKIQEDNGIDIITSGELSRDNYCSFVANKIIGARLMPMSDMLDYIDDKEAFEEILKKLDAPLFSIRNAICSSKLKFDKNLALNELLLLKKFTKKPIKITLPGAYLLTRSMWLANLSKNAYKNKEELGKDVLKILKQEVDALVLNGVFMIQLDEPVLTEVVFTKGKPRSFMCAALSERKDPKEELDFAKSLIQEIVKYINDKGVISSLHVCRGNWSSDEETLLSGPYTPLIDILENSFAKVLSLEFSTPRAGEISSLFKDNSLSKNIILGLGVINPRIAYVEKIDDIVKRCEEAMKYVPTDRLWLNPDCGFSTFSNRPVNSEDIIVKKLQSLYKSAEVLRKRYA